MFVVGSLEETLWLWKMNVTANGQGGFKNLTYPFQRMAQ